MVKPHNLVTNEAGPVENKVVKKDGKWFVYSEDGKISAGREELWMTYIYGVTDPNAMTPDFREVVAYGMAIEAAIDIVGSRALSETMEARHASKMLKAMGTDAQGDGPRQLPRGSWVTERNRGYTSVISS